MNFKINLNSKILRKNKNETVSSSAPKKGKINKPNSKTIERKDEIYLQYLPLK